MATNIINMWKAKISLLFAFFFLLFSFSSCDSFLDIQPTGKVIAETGEEYRALLTGVYNNFPDDRSLTVFRTDEMTLDPASTTNEDLNSYFDIWTWNDITPDENTASYSWRRFYHTIYIANYIIEHQTEITEAKTDEIRQMVGEAYMLRAYSHFVLVNLFGEPYTHCNPGTSLAVPLSVVADVDAVLPRSTVESIYQQILSDIDAAKQNLNVATWEAELNYRFNVVSAEAFRARVCLYMGKWQEALSAAKAVIEAHPELEDLTKNGYTMPDNYKSVESITCLEQVMKSSYKGVGYPTVAFINSFRTGDIRKSRFFKAQTSRVYTLLKGGDQLCRSTFRSSEAYLTAAEAAAHLGNLDEAITLITPLVQHRYLAAMQTRVLTEVSAMNQDELIDFILSERAHELCYEGHRWFDLRRTTQPRIEKTYNDVTYVLEEHDSRYTMPIPTAAISANPGLATEK